MRAIHWLLRSLAAGLLLLLVGLGACRDSPVSLSPRPELASLRVSANLSGTPVTTVRVTVTAADIPDPLVFNLEIQNGVASGTLRVPTGAARTFTGSAFAANGEVTHEGSVTTDVRRSENPPLTLVLRPLGGDVPIVITLARYSVEVTPATVELPVGRTLILVATIRDTDGNVVQGEVVWASLNPAFATVDRAGIATAHRAGEVQLLASYAGVSGSVRITVVPRPPAPRQIAFASYPAWPSSTTHIYVMDEDGSNVRQLTNQPGENSYPDWSPDGGQILFQRNTGIFDTTNLIWVMNADGSNPRQLTVASWDKHARWSPDGRKIAFARGSEIFLMNADGSDIRRLTYEGGSAPTWSPDGSRIAFESTRDRAPPPPIAVVGDIYRMNSDGSDVQRLTHSGGNNEPNWSPDGTRIIFASNRDGNNEIYVMDADGSNVRRLTNHPSFDRHPSWSPDGTKITFVSSRDGGWSIYVMNADGSDVRRLTFSRSLHPAWQR